MLLAAIGDNQIYDVESQISIGMNGERRAAVLACGGLVRPCVEELTKVRDALLEHRSPGSPPVVLSPRKGPGLDVLIEGGIRVLKGELIPTDAGILGMCRSRNADRCNGKGEAYPSPLDLRRWELQVREIYGILNDVPFVTEDPFDD